MLAAHDSNQRAVVGVGLEFVPVARGHDGKVAPDLGRMVFFPGIDAPHLSAAGCFGRGRTGLITVLLASRHPDRDKCGGESGLHVAFLSVCPGDVVRPATLCAPWDPAS